MAIINLKADALSARISTRGGIILSYFWKRNGQNIPLLREAPGEDADALASGCYPLVPFGNRVKDNRFTFGGSDHAFEPNTDWDRHYLHGDGWQRDWEIIAQSSAEVELGFAHKGPGTPYVYAARQLFRLTETGLNIRLTVENRGPSPLPFGLGWHPYFPLTPRTTLLAPAKRFWTETADWLPGEATDFPADLDISRPSPLPHRWINNGIEGWSGTALIDWPDARTRLRLTADSLFRHAFLFVSDTAFDPEFKRDFFCFEPMSHLTNGHNLINLGDLAVLAPGEHLTGAIRLAPEPLPETDPAAIDTGGWNV